MIYLKESVDLAGVQPEIVHAIHVANDVYNLHGADCTVTSVRDSVHRRGSLHYVGLACDLRIAPFMENASKLLEVVETIRTALGKQYDVVLESDHIHVEFQPKEKL